MDARPAGSLIESARRAFPLLERVGTRGFLVGGAVRDLILGREPRDADVAIVDAAGEAERFAASCKGRVVRLGSAPFDVVRVAASGVVYDFAEIVGASIEDDLWRRDFTIGAIAIPLDPSRDVIDPFDGVGDLRRSTLRMIREPNFTDDPLRVVRGARLVAELALTIDAETFDAMLRHAASLAGTAPERLGVEWLALLSAADEDALRRALLLIRELGIDRLVAGAALSDEAIALAARTRGGDDVTRLAAIALEGDEAALCDAAMRLAAGSTRVDAIRRAHRLARRLLDADATSPIDPVALHDEGEEATRRAIVIARSAGREELAGRVGELVVREGSRIFGARPLLDGHAIVSITGLRPGPRVGEIRRALLVAQLRGEVSDEGEALAFVRRMTDERP